MCSARYWPGSNPSCARIPGSPGPPRGWSRTAAVCCKRWRGRCWGMPFHWRSSRARPSPASWLPVCRPPSRWPRPTTTLPTISPTCCTAAARSGSIPIRTSSVCSWAGRSRTSSPSVPVSPTVWASAPTPGPRSSPGGWWRCSVWAPPSGPTPRPSWGWRGSGIWC